jgi:endonuclease/exonuclease/phosphatase family metal-dependent hydrolase
MNDDPHDVRKPLACTPQEFHRRRAETEMERALGAGKMSISLIHLELAKIHRQRREQLLAEDRARPRNGAVLHIGRTDKES